jgi:hypothetical protein
MHFVSPTLFELNENLVKYTIPIKEQIYKIIIPIEKNKRIGLYLILSYY